MSSQQPKFSGLFKARAVALAVNSKLSLRVLAGQLQVPYVDLRKWKQAYAGNVPRKKLNAIEVEKELKALNSLRQQKGIRLAPFDEGGGSSGSGSDSSSGGPLPSGSGSGGPLPSGSGSGGPLPSGSGSGGPLPSGSGSGGPLPSGSGSGGPLPSSSGPLPSSSGPLPSSSGPSSSSTSRSSSSSSSSSRSSSSSSSSSAVVIDFVDSFQNRIGILPSIPTYILENIFYGSDPTSSPSNEFAFYLRLKSGVDYGSTVNLTLNSYEDNGLIDSQIITLIKQTGRVYLSGPIIAYRGDLDGDTIFGIETTFSLTLIHNAKLEAVLGSVKETKPTYKFSIVADHPNILTYFHGAYASQTRQSTKLEITGSGPNVAGKKIDLSATGIGGGNALLNTTSVTLDGNGYASVIFHASTVNETVIVTAKSNGAEVGKPVTIYHAPFNFTNLTNNPGMAGYTDSSYVNHNEMSAADIQAFLVSKNSGLKNFVEGGVSASDIIKNAAEASSINPKLIVVTLQKERQLISEPSTLDANNPRMKSAMGVKQASANTFTKQVNAGAQTFQDNFENPTFIKIKIATKYHTSGSVRQDWIDNNVLCALAERPSPSFNVRLDEAVQFGPLNKSTMAQTKFTTYLISFYTSSVSPAGGVYLFYALWKQYFHA